ncbi:MAG: putative regulatory protein [Streptomyces oryziradicis]|jgi:anti-sigma regulatory factor (Ser/Thr protein kinase)|nr:putative regulatory protein [Actinacidiphila oryziradicis]
MDAEKPELWDYCLCIPNDPRAASLARLILRSVLGLYGLGELTDTAQLVAAELVGNALRHSDGPVHFRMCHRDGSLRLGVSDNSPEPPAYVPLTDDAEGGRGLHLVNGLAEEWGYCVLGEEVFGLAGKLVWADIPAAAGSPLCV